MRDEPDPPRKIFQLKPREFEAVNKHSRVPPSDASPTDVQGHLRAANAKTPLPQRPAAPPPPSPNDVQILLREHQARNHAAGLDELTPMPTRRSRRKRDYWLVLIPVDLFFVVVTVGPFASPSMRLYAFSGFVMFTLGLTWIMWFVMDDY